MLKNYLKIALRNLFKNKGYSIINITSLAVGIGCFLFLLLLDQYAYQFDTFHENADRIYRVNDRIITQSGSEINAAITPWPWAEALKSEYPVVEDYVRFLGRGHSITRGKDAFNYRVNYVDPSFFDVFSFNLAKGDETAALDGPGKVVLSPWTAKNIFGNEDPVGKAVQIDDEGFEVTGVLEENPDQSSIYFDMLVSSANLNENNFATIDNWKTHNIHTYLLLREGSDKAKVEQNFNSFLEKYIDQDAADRYTPWLQNITDLYLGEQLFAEHGATLEKSYVIIFTSIAFLVLLISCINFINISTARAAKRNIEVGIRKVIGAVKRQLIFQYLLEVFLISLFAVGISFILVEWALPWFNQMTDWTVQVGYFDNPFIMISALLVVLFVTFVAGGYPAFYLSKFHPTKIFRDSGSKKRKSLLRSGLVVTQFTLAVFLVVSSMVVDRQINFLYNKDLGFEDENVMQILMSEEVGYEDARMFRQELLRNPEIQQVSLASNGPFSGASKNQYNVEQSDWDNGILMTTFYIDDQFIPLFDLELVIGRNFNPGLATDSVSSFILNESAAQKFGWDNSSAIGKTIVVPKSESPDLRGTVIGVVKDFHFESLRREIEPLVMRYRPREFNNALVKIQTTDLSRVNQLVNDTWKSMFPGQYFHHFYVEDNLSDTYDLEEIIANLLSLLTYLTIFIACLGLLGLASYTTLQRTKEIGIRKVMGATVQEIVSMLSKSFMRYVIFALIIGIPLAYFGINQWLQNFAYHTDVGVMTIVYTVVITIALALATVSWQSIRAATANPVDSLRNE